MGKYNESAAVIGSGSTHAGFQASSLPYLLKVASMGSPFYYNNSLILWNELNGNNIIMYIE